MSTDDDRVLYQGRSDRAEICVTMTWCVANGSRYPIVDLSRLGSRRGERDLRGGRSVQALAVVTLVLVLSVIAIRQGWTRDVWPAVTVAVAVTAAVTALPWAIGVALRRPYQIWAHHQGAEVLLFVTNDHQQHGEVSRALIRACEYAED